MQTSQRIYASDASPSGGGVTYTDVASEVLPRALRVLSETRVEAGWYTSLFLSACPPRMEEVGGARDLSTNGRVSPRFSALLSGWDFRVAIATAWRTRSAHIKQLEMEAVKLAVQHMSKTSGTRDGRVVLLVDSAVALGALGKGRSASHALNRLCRQVFASTALYGVSLALHWVPSGLNPADEPSRRVRRPRQRRPP